MKRSLLTRTLAVAGVTLISIHALIGLPFSKQEALDAWHRNIRLGADLKGGMQLILEVAWREAWVDQKGTASGPPADFRERVMRQTREVIEKKVNNLGVSEETVQFAGTPGAEDRLLVELPGIDDPARVKRVLSTAAVLEWLDVRDGPFASREEAFAKHHGTLPPGTQLRQQVPNGPWYLLATLPVVRGTDLRDAQLTQSDRGWATSFVLSQEAARRFEIYTAANIGRPAAIVLDHKILSVPVIDGKISDTGQILGARTRDEADELAVNLRSGSLPARLTELDERTVGPSLGSDSIKQGFEAGAAGLGAVSAAMVTYYKRSGAHAVLALLLNALILLAALTYLGAVLTLPGIAGLILTIGMAVDSNVLVFERIREELRSGKTAYVAVDAGFRHAFATIVDTHVTTLVACGCLFYFGTTAVQGFAVTLAIGLIANVFTAVFVSRLLFDWELRKPGARLSI
jgi:preprotein translocase subunit SecD